MLEKAGGKAANIMSPATAFASMEAYNRPAKKPKPTHLSKAAIESKGQSKRLLSKQG